MSSVSTENYKHLWEAISNNVNKELNPEQFINFNILITVDHELYLTSLKRGELKESNKMGNLIVYYLPYKNRENDFPIPSQNGFEDFDMVVFFLFNEFQKDNLSFAIIPKNKLIPKNKFCKFGERLREFFNMNFISIKKVYEDEGLDEFVSSYYIDIIKEWERIVGLNR